jgi:hypothetical protein
MPPEAINVFTACLLPLTLGLPPWLADFSYHAVGLLPLASHHWQITKTERERDAHPSQSHCSRPPLAL